MGQEADGSSYWEVMQHVASVMAEALVASALYRADSDARLEKPRHPGFDASSQALDVRVDAKLATILIMDLNEGPADHVEWRSSAGTIMAAGATHLGLVVLDRSSSVRLTTPKPEASAFEVHGEVSGRVFILSRQVAERARPTWSRKLGRSTRGHYRYLSLRDVLPFEVHRSTDPRQLFVQTP